jgi:HemY protein
MLRLVGYFLAIAIAAYGMSWLYDNRGSIVVDWQGIVWYTDAFQVTILLALLAITLIILWTVMRGVWQSPATIGNFFNRRREKRGLEALSSGMIAIGAGDKALATRYAVQARKSLPNEPMTHLLRAQAAQLAGDRTTSRRIFEAMLASPDTEALGLRGLFLEAEREGEKVAARQFAERAVRLNPKLVWPVDALFDIQCREGDWDGALETLSVAKKNGHVEKTVADRRRAVLLTAQAQKAEDADPERAMNLALEAHKLAVDLVPAAAIAGRLLASRGNTPKAAGILQKTWRKSPHPELAVAYAYARLGDSPRDRLERVGQLAALTPNVIESPIAIANAAIEAKSYDAARKALEPLIEGRLTQRVCTLMARIESEQHGNTVAVREWLARAVNAPRDPAWTADGIVSDHWSAVSPVTGALDAFQWRVPVEAAEPRDKEFLAQKIEELVALGTRPETMIVSGATPVAAPPTPTESQPAQPRSSASAPRADAVDVEVVEVRPQPQNSLAGSSSPEPEQQSDRPTDAGGPAAGKSDPAAPKAAEGRTSEVRTPAETVEQDARGAAGQPTTGRAQSDAQEAGKAPSSSPRVAKIEAGSPLESSGQTSSPTKETGGKVEPKIFVAPRAPDDPGTESADEIPSGLRSGGMR